MKSQRSRVSDIFIFPQDSFKAFQPVEHIIWAVKRASINQLPFFIPTNKSHIFKLANLIFKNIVRSSIIIQRISSYFIWVFDQTNFLYHAANPPNLELECRTGRSFPLSLPRIPEGATEIEMAAAKLSITSS